MKLRKDAIAGYVRKPEAGRTGVLIFGADGMRIAIRRQELVASLLGPQGEEEMRLTRMPASDLRKDPAQLLDAIKAQGFFPGPRVVFVEDATDALADPILAAVAEWREGDAQIVVTAGALKPTSRLRKAFENHANGYAVAIYDDPPTREEMEATLRDAGLGNAPPEALRDLSALALTIEPGDFRQTVEKLSLYKQGDPKPISAADIAACAPMSTEADIDDILHVVAESRTAEIAPVLSRLQSQGTLPVSLCIAALRHFRTLYAAASHPDGPGAGMAKMRPPIFGPRRDRMLRQAQDWGPARLETALSLVTDTDLKLRSAGQHAPAMALVERMLIRLAMLNRRR